MKIPSSFNLLNHNERSKEIKTFQFGQQRRKGKKLVFDLFLIMIKIKIHFIPLCNFFFSQTKVSSFFKHFEI